MTRLRHAAIAWFFLAIGCYTMLAPIDGPVAVGTAVLPRGGAIALAATIVVSGVIAALSVARRIADGGLAVSRRTLAWWGGALVVPAALGFAPGRSFSMIGLAALAAGTHLAIVRWWSPGLARALRRTVLTAGGLLALSGLVMQLTHRPAAVYAANLGRATGLFVTPNQFAAWLVPFTALAAGVALAARGRERFVAAGVAALGALTLAGTFSLGGWLGGVTAFVLAAWWLGRRRAALAVAGLAIAAAVVVACFPAVTHHRASERLVRLEALGAGLHVAAVFPLFGVGPLAYPTVYPTFRVPATTEDAIVREHPHDVTVSLLAETGVAGLLAIVAGWLVIGRAIRRASAVADARTRAFVACVAAGLAGRFAHGLVDLVGVLELAFVWVPFTALALAAARDGWDGGVES